MTQRLHSPSAAPRLFIQAALTAGSQVCIGPRQAHHVANVLRRPTGTPLRLFNGRDGEWLARIAGVYRGSASVTIETQLRPQLAEPVVWLAFSLLKRDATDLVVQKATELGASSI